MASLKLLPPLILILSLLSAAAQSPPPPPQCLTNAEDALAASGHIAMSLTLHAIAPTLPRPSATTTALTIFSPPDAAFTTSGQPSLAHLLLHFSPLSISPATLLSLPYASTLPSLTPSKRLTITSTANNLSVNNVRISKSPIFDDGFVIVYAIDNFFDLNFTIAHTNSTNGTANPKSDLQCLQLDTNSRFEEASGVMKSHGYSIMASFLELQLIGFRSDDVMKWTVFAPVNETLVPFSGEFLRYSSLFMRHVVPCKVGWKELDETVNGTVISNNVLGFGLEITKAEDDEKLMVNGVEITKPGMYDSEWLVVHGIKEVIALPVIGEEETEYADDFPADEFEELVPP